MIRFYFPGVLVGPCLDYVSYISLVDGSLFQSVEFTKPTRRAIPDGRKRVAYRKMLTGLVFLGLFVIVDPSYNYAMTLTPWFAEQSFLYRYVQPRVVGMFRPSSLPGSLFSNSMGLASVGSTMLSGP